MAGDAIAEAKLLAILEIAESFPPGEDGMLSPEAQKAIQTILATPVQVKGQALSHEMAFAQGNWSPYPSRTGKPAWKNRLTGEIRYQRNRPGEVREADYRTQPPPQRRQPASAPAPQEGDWRAQPPPQRGQQSAPAPEAKAVPEHRQRLNSWMAGELASSGLSAEKQAQYAGAADRVFSQYTPKAAERFAAGIKQSSRFFSDNQALNDQFVSEYQTHPIAESVRSGKGSIGGMYKRKNGGSLYLDGDWSRKRDPTGSKTHEVYAHEFMHAIDGPKNEISRSAAWQDAWKNEIVKRGVSAYAWTEPAEGLAEFGRLLYSGTTEADALKKNYPKCMKVLHDWGLHAHGA